MIAGDKVSEKAVEQYHHAGKSRELFADESETIIHGDYVQSYVYDAEQALCLQAVSLRCMSMDIPVIPPG